MKSIRRISTIFMSLSAILLIGSSVPVQADGGVKATYLYSLSNFTGTVPYSWVRNFIDPERNEIFVVTGDSVSVFNGSGMEVYRFGEDLELGSILDAAVENDGHILLLSMMGDRFRVTRCSYRGEPQSRIELRNLPREFSGISPGRILFRNGRMYLADLIAKKVVVTDEEGIFQEGYDIPPFIAGFEDKPGSENNISCFTVDREGNLFFTIPTLFKVFRISPDRKLAAFGEPGNIPGKFNVVAGIAVDDRGTIFVTDTLRSVVMVFDKEFKFQAQFSHRGLDPGGLIAPKDMAIDRQGRLYVSQARKRGISVFQIHYD
jgi:hypothetical protein